MVKSHEKYHWEHKIIWCSEFANNDNDKRMKSAEDSWEYRSTTSTYLLLLPLMWQLWQWREPAEASQENASMGSERTTMWPMYCLLQEHKQSVESHKKNHWEHKIIWCGECGNNDKNEVSWRLKRVCSTYLSPINLPLLTSMWQWWQWRKPAEDSQENASLGSEPTTV